MRYELQHRLTLCTEKLTEICFYFIIFVSPLKQRCRRCKQRTRLLRLRLCRTGPRATPFTCACLFFFTRRQRLLLRKLFNNSNTFCIWIDHTDYWSMRRLSPKALTLQFTAHARSHSSTQIASSMRQQRLDCGWNATATKYISARTLTHASIVAYVCWLVHVFEWPRAHLPTSNTRLASS